jgi:hypothetical protein
MTPLSIALHAAERAHRELRSAAPEPGSIAGKEALLDQILPALDTAARELPDLYPIVDRLRADAEHFAGHPEAQGFAAAYEAWLAYEDLRAASRARAV